MFIVTFYIESPWQYHINGFFLNNKSFCVSLAFNYGFKVLAQIHGMSNLDKQSNSFCFFLVLLKIVNTIGGTWLN